MDSLLFPYEKKALTFSLNSTRLMWTLSMTLLSSVLQSNQVKRTPQESINEFIIQKLNLLLVVDFRLISAFLYV